jgi:ankyrin repeat protein
MMQSRMDELLVAMRRLEVNSRAIGDKAKATGRAEMLSLQTALLAGERSAGSNSNDLTPQRECDMVFGGLGGEQIDEQDLAVVKTLLSDVSVHGGFRGDWESEGKHDDKANERLSVFLDIQKIRQLAMQSFENGEYGMAEKRLKQVIEQSEATYGLFYTWKDETVEALVRLYAHRREWKEAENMWSPTVETLKTRLGTGHPSFQHAASLLMRIYCSGGKVLEAQVLDGDLTEAYWSTACYEVVALGLLEEEEAVQKVARGYFKDLANEGGERWGEIKQSIKAGGIYGVDGTFTLLHRFCETASEAAVRLILDMEIRATNVDGKEKNGRTGMHMAAANGSVDIVKLLLRKNASVEARTRYVGETPLILAAKYNHVAVVQLLIDHDAKIEAPDAFGYTAFHHAVLEGATEVVDTLISNGANIDTRGHYGRTPLHCAASKGDDELVERLLKEGANPNEIDDSGQTALMLAQTGKVANILRRRVGGMTTRRPTARLRRY